MHRGAGLGGRRRGQGREPEVGHPGRSAVYGSPDKDLHYFLILNANKRSMTIDLKSPEGKKLLLDLAAKADVMVENFAPGAIERLGLGYDVVLRSSTPASSTRR